MATIIVSAPMVLDPWFAMPILSIGMGYIALAILSAAPRARLR